jgi:hypothetical protein
MRGRAWDRHPPTDDEVRLVALGRFLVDGGADATEESAIVVA